jgi:hypothetical protein
MTEDRGKKPLRVWADFNGFFGDILCLSHKDTALSEHGKEVVLRAGMNLTAYMEDSDENGNPDNLIASGTVEPSPHELHCLVSRWVLRIDENGVRHDSDLKIDQHS